MRLQKGFREYPAETSYDDGQVRFGESSFCNFKQSTFDDILR